MKETLKYYSILYAEDNKLIQESMKTYLERYFKTVHVANDGKEALSLYAQCQPDVALLDVDMPYVDGLSVAKKIREKNVNIPILILTAFTDTQMLLEATELHLTKNLVKPVDPKAFKEALDKVVNTLQLVHSDFVYLDDDYRWEVTQEVLYQGDEFIELSQKERVLLSLFVKHRQHCVSFEEIMASVWEEDVECETSIDSVKYQVSQLRKKLPRHSIQNVYGRGYKLG